MNIDTFDPQGNNWHVYKDGGIVKVFPKELYSKTELLKVWQAKHPESSITVK